MGHVVEGGRDVTWCGLLNVELVDFWGERGIG